MLMVCSPLLASEDVEVPADLASPTSAAIDRAVPATSAAPPTKTSRRDMSRPALGTCSTVRLFIARSSGLLGDFHEASLNELDRPRHGIRVDPDAGKQVGVDPPVRLGGCAAQLDLNATSGQDSDQILVGIAGRYIPFGVVGAVVQRHVAGVRVKHGDKLGLGVPTGDVVPDELQVENRSGQITLERQGTDTEHGFHV